MPLLLLTPGISALEFGLSLAAGATFAASVHPHRGAYVDNMMAAASMGVPLWGMASLIVAPLLSGNRMGLDAVGIESHFTYLFSWILFGALFGLLLQAMGDLAHDVWGPETMAFPQIPAEVRRILILGGGFGGMETARQLEARFAGDPSVSISVVSETNALLFTPMLAEVAGSSLEPSHISAPLRSSLQQTNFIRGRVTAIDLERQTVHVDGATPGNAESGCELPYDQLVLALGAVSNYLGMKDVESLAFDFRSLFDAIQIRNRIIEMFERADRELDPAIRKRLLTFVIAGGGFAGVELAGAINDFSHGILADYKNLSAGDLCVTLVHSRDRILPELSESLANYAMQKMKERGVVFRLGTRLTGAQPGAVRLTEGEIAAETLIWTAGTIPSPLIRPLDVAKDKRGAVLVDSTLAVPGHPGVWALGDCAAVKDGVTGEACPPTAQFALREAATVARNIDATLHGRRAVPFHFDSLGALCVIGHQNACAELTLPFARSRSVRFSGLFAWFLWRGIYVSKLPGMERKIRVLIAWTLELFFPRDIVQTIELSDKGADLSGRDHEPSRTAEVTI
jgi:NADH dehydrogenase